ncbi:MAG: hypothetical protein CM1200mP36_03800 [Gammaproteobacteria bacterium]|nr:MAG: hypothetical protein CM1200mP36_03800 [Gammaproteobacteria bacterium]
MFIEKLDHFTLRRYSLVGFDKPGRKASPGAGCRERRCLAGLIADSERIPKASRYDKRGSCPTTLQERIRGNSGPHADARDPSVFCVGDTQDPVYGFILVLRGVFRQQFDGGYPPAGLLATTSVKVPPRSIQNCQPVDSAVIRVQEIPLPYAGGIPVGVTVKAWILAEPPREFGSKQIRPYQSDEAPP